VAGAAGWVVVVTLATILAFRVFAFDRTRLLVILNAFTFWLYVPAYGVATFAVLSHRWVLCAASVFIAGVHVALVMPRVQPRPMTDSVGPRPVTLRLVSANLFPRNPKLDQLLAELVSMRPDVLLLQEVTESAEAVIARSGVTRDLPYHLISDRQNVPSTAIYSRFPLEDARSLPDTRILGARVSVGGRSLRVFNVYVLPPRWFRTWHTQLETLLRALELEHGAVVAAGDLNLTRYNRLYGRLADGPLRDALRDCGSRVGATWPNGRLPVPPLRIDHVFVSPAVVCLGTSLGSGLGSDHRPVLVELGLFEGSR
jgi:endonuclease/exonuclease/phosphatase (EEP) superfamily protein YafD